METKETQNIDRYEYCYQLVEDIGETANELEETFKLQRRPALKKAVELVCINAGVNAAPLMELFKEG